MHLTKIIAICLFVGGLAAWKCGCEKKAEDDVQQPPAAGSASEVSPTDMNVNQPADMTAPGGTNVEPSTGDANGMDPAMGGASPADEVPVGTEGVEPGVDYTGEQAVEAGPGDGTNPAPGAK